jgi:tetratricopeptide (TPR) repeat protein
MKYILYSFLLYPLLVFSQADFSQAEKLFNQAHYIQAKPIFLAFLKENPNHLKTLEYLGDIEGNLKSWNTAIAYYNKLKKLNPKEADYYYKYGGCLGMKAKESSKFKALGMISEIRGSFEKAIELNPNHIESRWALIELYLQLPGIVGGSERKAERYADELLKISPVDGYLAKGHIDEYFNRFKEAEKNYSKAIAIGHSKNTFQKLYNLYCNKMKDFDKAKKLKKEFENNSQS